MAPVEWETEYPKYAAEIRDEAGSKTLMASDPVAAANSMDISVPSARLGPGKYLIILYGVPDAGDRKIVGRYPLTIAK